MQRTRYYLVAVMYTCARLCINISTAILPFYLTGKLGLPNLTIAEVPGGKLFHVIVQYILSEFLIMFGHEMNNNGLRLFFWCACGVPCAVIYCVSILISVFLQKLHWEKDRLAYAYGFGCVIWFLTALTVFLFGNSLSYSVFAASVAIGTGNTLMLVSSISMEAELVGDTQKGGAFVYGSLSFLDKTVCGVAIFVIELMKGAKKDTANDVVYYAVTAVPGLAGCVGLFFAILYLIERKLKRMKRNDSSFSVDEAQDLRAPLLE